MVPPRRLKEPGSDAVTAKVRRLLPPASTVKPPRACFPGNPAADSGSLGPVSSRSPSYCEPVATHSRGCSLLPWQPAKSAPPAGPVQPWPPHIIKPSAYTLRLTACSSPHLAHGNDLLPITFVTCMCMHIHTYLYS